VLLVLTAVPMAMFMGAFLPAFAEMMSQAASGAEPSAEDMFALQARMMALNPLMTLCSLAVRTLLMCAIFRAVLTPEDSRFYYLRFGKTELLVGAVYLCLIILMAIVAVVGVLLLVAIGAVLWFASKGLAIGIGILGALALLVAIVWAMLRLWMALPMTFTERRFRFFEAWTLTRGQSGSLFLIGLLLIAIVFLMELLIGGVIGALVLAFLMGHPLNEQSITAFFQQPVSQWSAQLAPLAMVAGVVFALVGAAFYTVVTAPWAAAYRMLVPAALSEALS